MTYLKHHGISGQKWGVRNGPPYPLHRRYSRNAKKANDIYNTMTDKEKYYVTAHKDSPVYVTDWVYKNANTFSFIEQYKDTPVSFFDIWADDEGHAEATIGVRNDERFRHKGYARRAMQEGLKYFENDPKIKELEAYINKDNLASITLAELNGFVRRKDLEKDKDWVVYMKEKDKK